MYQILSPRNLPLSSQSARVNLLFRFDSFSRGRDLTDGLGAVETERRQQMALGSPLLSFVSVAAKSHSRAPKTPKAQRAWWCLSLARRQQRLVFPAFTRIESARCPDIFRFGEAVCAHACGVCGRQGHREPSIALNVVPGLELSRPGQGRSSGSSRGLSADHHAQLKALP
jgi:hypothetical protein